MKNVILFCCGLCILLFFSSCACVPLRKYHDKRVTRYIKRNLPSVYALGDSLRAAANNNKEHPDEDTLKDMELKKKLGTLGYYATVHYKGKYPYRDSNIEPCDSVVIFEQMSILLGIREIVYDFSVIPKSYPEDLNYRNFYSFRKAAPKIYIRRRQIPMM